MRRSGGARPEQKAAVRVRAKSPRQSSSTTVEGRVWRSTTTVARGRAMRALALALLLGSELALGRRSKSKKARFISAYPGTGGGAVGQWRRFRQARPAVKSGSLTCQCSCSWSKEASLDTRIIRAIN